jgi:hypothetical protein
MLRTAGSSRMNCSTRRATRLGALQRRASGSWIAIAK